MASASLEDRIASTPIVASRPAPTRYYRPNSLLGYVGWALAGGLLGAAILGRFWLGAGLGLVGKYIRNYRRPDYRTAYAVS